VHLIELTSRSSILLTLPPSCTFHLLAPHRHRRYTAKLSNSRAANPKGSKSARAPFTDVSFAMTLPDGVMLKSYKAGRKLATVPAVDPTTGLLTWDLGSVRPGDKVGFRLKLVASACTTPAPLALDGQFTYTDAAGVVKTVDALLKKPVYVWEKGCPALPRTKGLMGHKLI
jgi:hypothetical protein